MARLKNILFVILLLAIAVPASAQKKGIDEIVRPH